MRSIYIVQAVAVRTTSDSIAGWVRVDPLAHGTRPTDLVHLRDGTSCGQAKASKRIRSNPDLLYPTEAEAVSDGIVRLRAAEARGDCLPLRR